MTVLKRIIPRPQLTEIDRIDVAASAVDVWELLRRGELAHSRPIRALFRLRTVNSRAGRASPTIRIDSLRSTPEQPGFQVLIDEPPHEFAVGAIGKVWCLDIPFVHVADEQAFAAFARPDFVKVAWAIRVCRAATECHVEVEVGRGDRRSRLAQVPALLPRHRSLLSIHPPFSLARSRACRRAEPFRPVGGMRW